MPRYFAYFLVWVAAITLSACACPRADMAQSAPLYNGQADTSTSLEGVDGNRNGVRDDVEQAIDRAYRNPQQQHYLKGYARALQGALLVDPENKADALPAHDELMRRTGCLYLAQKNGVFAHDASVREKTDFIDGIILNTEVRQTQYKDFVRATRFAPRPPVPSEEQCER